MNGNRLLNRIHILIELLGYHWRGLMRGRSGIGPNTVIGMKSIKPYLEIDDDDEIILVFKIISNQFN